jgi:hypothetical protein
MLDCRDRLPDLVAYVDGELDAPRSAAIEAHLATCAACRAERELLAGTGRLLGAFAAPEPAPGFEARVRARIAAAEAAERKILAPAVPAWRRLGARAAAPAAAAAAVLLAAVGIAARFGLLDRAIDPGAGGGRGEVAAVDPATRATPGGARAPEIASTRGAGSSGAPSSAFERPALPPPPAIAPSPGRAAPPPASLDPGADEPELMAKLDVVENLELLQNLEMLEIMEAPEDPTAGLEEDRG